MWNRALNKLINYFWGDACLRCCLERCLRVCVCFFVFEVHSVAVPALASSLLGGPRTIVMIMTIVIIIVMGIYRALSATLSAKVSNTLFFKERKKITLLTVTDDWYLLPCWKHGALCPQKPLRLIRDGEAGGREFLYLTPTRYTVTTRMTLH